MHLRAWLVVGSAVTNITLASGDRTPPTAEPTTPGERPASSETTGDVAGLPPPGEESGRVDRTHSRSATRTIGQVALFVPWLATEIVYAPIRGALWTYDRFQLRDRYYDTFYNRDRTIGLVPTAGYSTGYGLTVGAAFVATDVFGKYEEVHLAATTGGEFRQSYQARVATGDRFGRLELRLEGDYTKLPQNPFYGIGNGDKVDQPPAMPIDPLIDDTAFKTFNRYQDAAVQAAVDVRLLAMDCAAPDALPIAAEGAWPYGLAGVARRARRCGVHLIATGQLASIEISPSTSQDPSLEQVYDTSALIGFDEPVRHAAGGLELRWDTRRRFTAWEPRDLHSTGSLVSVFGSRVAQNRDLPGFWRYGVELQHYWRLGSGPRTLIARLHGDGVTGDLDEVPVAELPVLGGDAFLRGYSYERFRDRVAAFGSVQYQWDVSSYLSPYLFVDAGRVFPGITDLTLSDLRVGYGIGVALNTRGGFVAEGTLASSIDGGIVVTLSFNPVLDRQKRWR